MRHADESPLAEYHRSARLDLSGRSVAYVELLIDTGGYSRTNLYRLNATQFLIRDADASYLIDTVARTIRRDDQRRKAGSFVGSFDADSSGVWRFIAATERSELPTEFRRE